MTPCYQRHELAPGVHVDVPHEHEGVAVNKSMAEVLSEHSIEWKRKDGPGDRVSFIATCFKCGPLAAARPSAHQADALTAAGFGPVKAAAAGPLRDAADRPVSGCGSVSVGGGHYTTCILETGHTGSHLDSSPWQPVNAPEQELADDYERNEHA